MQASLFLLHSLQSDVQLQHLASVVQAKDHDARCKNKTCSVLTCCRSSALAMVPHSVTAAGALRRTKTSTLCALLLRPLQLARYPQHVSQSSRLCCCSTLGGKPRAGLPAQSSSSSCCRMPLQWKYDTDRGKSHAAVVTAGVVAEAEQQQRQHQQQQVSKLPGQTSAAACTAGSRSPAGTADRQVLTAAAALCIGAGDVRSSGSYEAACRASVVLVSMCCNGTHTNYRPHGQHCQRRDRVSERVAICDNVLLLSRGLIHLHKV